MHDSASLIVVIVVALLVLVVDRRLSARDHAKVVDTHLAMMREQRVALTAVVSTTASSISDATAKAVQSITYPATELSALPNDLLPAVHEMPVLERQLELDYSDPTDGTMPDPAFLRPDASMLGDDPIAPFGIPGIKVDLDRYRDAG